MEAYEAAIASIPLGLRVISNSAMASSAPQLLQREIGAHYFGDNCQKGDISRLALPVICATDGRKQHNLERLRLLTPTLGILNGSLPFGPRVEIWEATVLEK